MAVTHTAMTEPTQPTTLSRRSKQRSLFARLLRNRLALIGMIITAIVVLTALLAPVLAPYDPLKINLPERLQGPSRGHIMGADHLGRDIFSRVVFGALISLEVGVVAVALGSVVGLIAGAAAGYLGKRTDTVIMALMDAIYAFPAILLALVLVAVFKPSLVTVMTAIAIVRIPIFARTVRASVLAEREREYKRCSTRASVCTGDGLPDNKKQLSRQP